MTRCEETPWAVSHLGGEAQIAPEIGLAVPPALQAELVFVPGRPRVATAVEVELVVLEALPSVAASGASWEEVWHGPSVWRKGYEAEVGWARVEGCGMVPTLRASVEEASSREGPLDHSAAPAPR